MGTYCSLQYRFYSVYIILYLVGVQIFAFSSMIFILSNKICWCIYCTTTCNCKFARNILTFFTFLLIASSLLPASTELPVVPASLPVQSVFVASYFSFEILALLSPPACLPVRSACAFLPGCLSVFTACLARLLICLFRLYRRGIIL